MKIKQTLFGVTLFLCSLTMLFSCATTDSTATKAEAYSAFYEETPPLSILIMPPINKTSNVEAKDYFYYTLQVELANMGYYTFPSMLAMETLQTESAYDSELFIDADISKFAQTFEADLLLFTTITKWEKHGVAGSVDVGVTYQFRSTATGEIVYERSGSYSCSTKVDTGLQKSGNGLVALAGLAINAAATAANTAATDYAKVATVCNRYAITIPYGKYSPLFQKDGEEHIGRNPYNTSGTITSVSDNFKYWIPYEEPSSEDANASTLEVETAQAVNEGSAE